MVLRDHYLNLRWQDQWQQGAAIAAIHNNGMRSYKTPPKADDFVFTIVPDRKQKHGINTPAKPENIFDLFREAAKDHASYG